MEVDLTRTMHILPCCKGLLLFMSLSFLPFFVDVTAIMFVWSSAYFVAFRVLFKLHLTVLKH